MDKFEEIPIDKIQKLENIRTRIKEREVSELMQNIKQHGLLQPVGVWITKEGEYVIAYGNRRLASCDKLGWKTITAKILGELSFEDLLIVNASENIHRKNINLSELGRIIHLLREKGLSNGEIAVRLGLNVKKIHVAYHSFKGIPEQYRDRIVFMTPGTRRKLGKIPATLFNTLNEIRREHKFTKKEFEDILDYCSKEDLTMSQIQLIALLLRSGSNMKEAIKICDDYNQRRITVATNKEVEEKLLIEYNMNKQGKLKKLFTGILNGKLRGHPGLVYDRYLS